MQADFNKLNGRIREVLGTQDNLATSIGMGRSTLNLKLNGKSDFTLSEIKRIVEVLNIPVSDITPYFFEQKV